MKQTLSKPICFNLKTIFKKFLHFTQIKTVEPSRVCVVSINMSISIQLFGLIFLCAFASQASAKSWQLKSRIVGGSSAVRKQFPYQVSLRIKENDMNLCGGSIINENYVLTAAHCFLHVRNPSLIYGVVNYTHITDDGIRYNFSHLAKHPHFRAYAPFYDIALLRTNKPIAFSEFVNKVNLPTHNYQPGTTAIMSGWGFIEVRFYSFHLNFISRTFFTRDAHYI